MSYDLSAEGSDADACYLESAISRERNPELKQVLQDLDGYLFRWWNYATFPSWGTFFWKFTIKQYAVGTKLQKFARHIFECDI